MVKGAALVGKRGRWQRLYEYGHQVRYRWWSTRAEVAPVPVVSVGNLHWGGTGKTPVVAAIAAALRDRTWRVVVLSRGYGRRGRGAVVVSRGGGAEVSVARAGDEPFLLAELLPGVGVVVAGDRRQGAEIAVRELGASVLLLDDGFSHLRLARDVDLVLLPAGDPFGGGLLPPGGRLREPLVALGRADAVAVVGATEVPVDVGAELDRLGFQGRREAIPFETGTAALVDGGGHPPGPVLLVAGIARPESFLQAARAVVADVVGELCFPDHHAYPPASLARIEKRAAELGAAAVLTTAKDRVKLQRRLALPLAELGLEAKPSADLLAWIDRRCREARRKDRD